MSNMIVDTKIVKTKKVVPDGGYGWVVVCALSVFFLIVIPMYINFGLIFKDKIIELQLAATNVAVIQNVSSAFGSFIGLLSAPFIKRFGCRTMALVTAIFFCSGFMLAGYATSFMTFLLSYSVLASIGIGFGWSSFFISMTSYFDVHRNKASGLAMTIAGIGPIIYPPMITLLLKFYGGDGCIWILAALNLNILAAALLLQPVKWHMKRIPIEDTEMSLINVETSNSSMIQHKSNEQSRKSSLQHNTIDANGSQSHIARIITAGPIDSIHHGGQTDSDNEVINRRGSRRSHNLKIDEETVAENHEERSSVVETNSNKIEGNIFRRVCNWLVDTFDLTLLKEVKFVLTLIGVSLSDFGEINYMMITPMILDELKYDIVEVASLISGTAIVDIVFRSVTPFIGDFLGHSEKLMYIYGLVVLLLAKLAIQFSTGYAWAMAGGVILGIGRAVTTVYWNVVFPSCVPIERLPCAMGILMIVNGFMFLLTGPIIGLLRDQTGNYTNSVHMINFITVLSIAVLAWLIRMDRKAAKAVVNEKSVVSF